jgi:hypothetical protein
MSLLSDWLSRPRGKERVIRLLEVQIDALKADVRGRDAYYNKRIARLERLNASLLDRLLERNGIAAVSKTEEKPKAEAAPTLSDDDRWRQEDIDRELAEILAHGTPEEYEEACRVYGRK